MSGGSPPGAPRRVRPFGPVVPCPRHCSVFPPRASSMSHPVRPRSNGARVTKCARKKRAVRVEHVCQLVSRGVAFSAAVVESPTTRQGQNLRVPLAQLSGASTVGVRLVEPHRLFFGVEGERCRCRCTTSGSRTLPLLHTVEDNAGGSAGRAMFTNA